MGDGQPQPALSICSRIAGARKAPTPTDRNSHLDMLLRTTLLVHDVVVHVRVLGGVGVHHPAGNPVGLREDGFAHLVEGAEGSYFSCVSDGSDFGVCSKVDPEVDSVVEGSK